MHTNSHIFTLMLLQSVTAFSTTSLTDFNNSLTPPRIRLYYQENPPQPDSPVPYHDNASLAPRSNKDLSIERSVGPASCDREDSLIPVTTLEKGYIAILLDPGSHETYNSFAKNARNAVEDKAKESKSSPVVKDKQNAIAQARRFANTKITDKLIAHMSLFQSISAQNREFFETCVSLGLLYPPKKDILLDPENELFSLFSLYKRLHPELNEDSLSLTIDCVEADSLSVIAKGVPSPALIDIHAFFKEYCCYSPKAVPSPLTKEAAQNILNIIKNIKLLSNPIGLEKLKNQARDIFISLTDISHSFDLILSGNPDVKSQIDWYFLLVELEQSKLNINLRDLYFLNDKEKPNHMLALFKRRIFEPHITVTQLKKALFYKIQFPPTTLTFSEAICGAKNQRTKHIAWRTSSSSMIMNMSISHPFRDRTNSSEPTSLSPSNKRQSSTLRDISLDSQRRLPQPGFAISSITSFDETLSI